MILYYLFNKDEFYDHTRSSHLAVTFEAAWTTRANEERLKQIKWKATDLFVNFLSPIVAFALHAAAI